MPAASGAAAARASAAAAGAHPAAAASVAPMELELRGVLDSNSVPTQVVDWMQANGCNTSKAFANWVDKREDLQDTVLAY
eukprot:16152241-Heterocapsa_arctica.AAC.1